MTARINDIDQPWGFAKEGARDHLIRVAFEEALHDERVTAEWYAAHPEYIVAWADLYGEHRVRLVCLEKIAEAAK